MQFPRMALIKQAFAGPTLDNIEQEVRNQLAKDCFAAQIKPKMRIAVTAGSRGIANIALIISAVCEQLRILGAEPFIIPAMGSHGGATAAGQRAVLESLGITECTCGAPILASMEVVQIGKTADQTPVFIDKHAWKADGIILVNRIKPHTDFHAPGGVESGLVKMAALGLGKKEQAARIHSLGVQGLLKLMPDVARVILRSGKIIGGLAILENAREETALLEGISGQQILEREPQLLQRAKELMPRLPLDDLDILLVDAMGKEFSGTGMDTNIIGRIGIAGQPDSLTPRIKYIIASDLTEKSGGNALGVGLADFVTERLLQKIDFAITNENVLTSTFIRRGMIPLTLSNTRECLQAALMCNWGRKGAQARVMRIPNTLHLQHLAVSTSLLGELKGMPNIEILREPEEISFDNSGFLPPLGVST